MALGIVIAGRTVLRRLTIPEGLTTWQTLERIRRAADLTGPITLKPAEGALMPDTYLFARGEARDAIVLRMQAAMTEALDRAWAERAPNLPLRWKGEALVLASIVEKETGKPGERARIAGVFVNRLRRGMRLETRPDGDLRPDRGQDVARRRLLRKDLKTPHRWNTYVHHGLPPTPIANPGRGAIEAAVRPLAHDELYSSPTAPAAMSSRRPTGSTAGRCANGARSAANWSAKASGRRAGAGFRPAGTAGGNRRNRMSRRVSVGEGFKPSPTAPGRCCALDHRAFDERAAFGDAAVEEGAEVEGAELAVEDPFGRAPAHRRRLLEAVAGKAVGEDEIGDFGVRPEDRVVVEGVVRVVAGP